MSEPRVLLQATDLAVAYGKRTALRGVTLPVREGVVTALIGPSGCGKTSFLSCVNRLTDLVPGCRVSGSLRLAGVELLDPGLDLPSLRRRVGMIFQRPNPFPLSIRQNLLLPLREHRLGTPAECEALAERALRDVGLWEEVKDRLDAPALSLSGGQQQRLCFARALTLRPEVLLLDEPCSALDPLATGVVEELILRLRGEYTVVIVTHNLAQARRLADDAALFWLRDGAGCLVEHGPAAQLFEAPRQPETADYVRGVRG
ncbi:MAG: phosphate ABC transporter ATP-binding protein [Armatimonadota bacterium]